LKESRPQAEFPEQEEIFISYAWGDPRSGAENREAIVDRLCATLETQHYKIIRDKKDNGYRKLISTFMQRIGRGKLVVVVVSDKYLKSPYCMYELLEIDTQGGFYERIFPIVLPDAKLYDLADRLRYVKYWRDKKKEIEDLITGIGIEAFSADAAFQEYDLYYRRVFNNIDKLTRLLADWNALTPELLEENNFDKMLTAIDARLKELAAKD
jgi:internalin A